MSARGVPAGDLSKAKRSPEESATGRASALMSQAGLLAYLSSCTPTHRIGRVVRPKQPART